MALLPDTDLRPASSVADRIRTSVEGLGIEHSGSDSGYVTVSIGVAAASPLVGDNLGELVQAADKALRGQAGRTKLRPSRGGDYSAALTDFVALCQYSSSTAS